MTFTATISSAPTSASAGPEIESSVVDLDRFVNEAPVGAFHIKLVFWALLVMIADGFDLVVMAFAAPEIAKAWNIERESMGYILSASLVGMLIGTPIAGYLGDRFGRKPLIIASALLFGAATWATVLAAGAAGFFSMRLLAGFGLAGIVPNVTALVSEFMPKRSRGGFLIIVQLGVQLGAILPGLVAAYLVSSYGWQALFYIGGLCPILLAIILIFVLPESIKLLSLRADGRMKLLQIAKSINRTARLDGETLFATRTTNMTASLSPLVPFRNGMHTITALLWGMAFVSLFTNLLIASWAPTVLREIGFPPQSAALTVSLFAFGGLIGSVILMFGFNRYGFAVIVAFYLVAIPAVTSIGQPFVGLQGLPWIFLVLGICISGTQSAINSALGMLYPTSIRANCAGWGMAIARLGSIGGPLFGGYLIARQVSGSEFFATIALPLAVGLCLSAALTLQCWRRFNDLALDESSHQGK